MKKEGLIKYTNTVKLLIDNKVNLNNDLILLIMNAASEYKKIKTVIKDASVAIDYFLYVKDHYYKIIESNGYLSLLIEKSISSYKPNYEHCDKMDEKIKSSIDQFLLLISLIDSELLRQEFFLRIELNSFLPNKISKCIEEPIHIYIHSKKGYFNSFNITNLFNTF